MQRFASKGWLFSQSFFLKIYGWVLCKNRRSTRTSTSVKFNRSSFRSHIIGQCLHHVCGSRPESAERATAVHRPRDINTRADDRCTQVRESAWLADRPSGAWQKIFFLLNTCYFVLKSVTYFILGTSGLGFGLSVLCCRVMCSPGMLCSASPNSLSCVCIHLIDTNSSILFPHLYILPNLFFFFPHCSVFCHSFPRQRAHGPSIAQLEAENGELRDALQVSIARILSKNSLPQCPSQPKKNQKKSKNTSLSNSDSECAYF